MTEHTFDKTQWAKMDVFNQMGNIGSEVGRALSAKRNKKPDRCQAAFYRGLDLIDETTEQWAIEKRPGLKELLYARELFAESITTDKVDPTLEAYFMQYAIAARGYPLECLTRLKRSSSAVAIIFPSITRAAALSCIPPIIPGT